MATVRAAKRNAKGKSAYARRSALSASAIEPGRSIASKSAIARMISTRSPPGGRTGTIDGAACQGRDSQTMSFVPVRGPMTAALSLNSSSLATLTRLGQRRVNEAQWVRVPHPGGRDASRVELDRAKRPNLKTYVDRFAARPKVQDAMKAERLIQEARS